MTTGSLENFDLFTVGHSSHPIEHLLDLLRSARVTCVADVRSRPFSRRFPWFSQKPLMAHLEDTSIGYMACGEALGGRPADAALFHDGIADFESMADTEAFRVGLDCVVAANRNHRLCLMCAEKEPLDCHRCLLVARALAARAISVGHILADGTIEPQSATEDRLLAITRTGDDLFGSDRGGRLAEAYRKRARAVAFRA